MINRAGLANEDMEFVQFHPTGEFYAVAQIYTRWLYLAPDISLINIEDMWVLCCWSDLYKVVIFSSRNQLYKSWKDVSFMLLVRSVQGSCF